MYGDVGPGPLSDSATYVIDDQNLIHFGNVSDFNNLMLFESGPLSPEQHKIVVTSNFGNNFSFLFEYFIQVQLDAPSSTAPSGSSSNSSPGKPTDAIIGGVIGGLLFISLLIAMFFFLRRRNNRRSDTPSEMSYAVPQASFNDVPQASPNDVPQGSPDAVHQASLDVVNPFTHPPQNPTSALLPKNYTSNSQSQALPSQSIPSKFSPVIISPSSESPRLSLTPSGSQDSQSNLDGARPSVPQATTEPSTQQSPSPQRANARFLRHEDSGVRMPPDEDDVIELPPLYTPG